MTRRTDFATDTYAFSELPYEFKSGTRILLSGRVAVECGCIPDTVQVVVADAVEPNVFYTTEIHRGHPIHRHIRMHVTGVDI